MCTQDAAASQQAVPGFCEDDEHAGPADPAQLLQDADDGGFGSGDDEDGWDAGADQAGWDDAPQPDLQVVPHLLVARC